MNEQDELLQLRALLKEKERIINEQNSILFFEFHHIKNVSKFLKTC